MTTPVLTPLGHDIFLIRDLLSPSLCQHIIQVAECRPFQSAGVLLGAVDKQVRSNDSLRLGEADPLLQSTNQLLWGRVEIAQQLLYQEYGLKFPYAEPCTILRYREGQFYHRHVDNVLLASRFQEVEQGIPTRDISVVGYLNANFSGGETYFDRQQLTVKPELGAVLLFPSYFTHPHASLPIQKGQKYAFTSWLFH